jgi:hypothetical protein
MRSIQSNAKPGNTAKKIVKIHVPKGYSEAVNQRTDNTMSKKKKTKD